MLVCYVGVTILGLGGFFLEGRVLSVLSVLVGWFLVVLVFFWWGLLFLRTTSLGVCGGGCFEVLLLGCEVLGVVICLVGGCGLALGFGVCYLVCFCGVVLLVCGL